jgi:hypothetical protein
VTRVIAVIRQGIPNGLEQKKKPANFSYLERKSYFLSCCYVMKRDDRQIICALFSDQNVDFKTAGKKLRRVHKFSRLIKISIE